MGWYNIFQIFVPRCSLTHSKGDCPATGEPCYNTPSTCQALDAYADAGAQYFFIGDSDVDFHGVARADFSGGSPFVDDGTYPVIPCVRRIQHKSAQLEPGMGIAGRETLRITVSDFATHDRDVHEDPYADERDYDPYERGTHWGKFVARYRGFEGYPVIWYQGYGDRLETKRTRVLFWDKIEGPNAKGIASITLKDPLKYAIDEKSKAPTVRGSLYLDENINSTDTGKVAYTPSNGIPDFFAQNTIGQDFDYPKAQHYKGTARIGSELIRYSIAADATEFYIDERGVLGTEAEAHDAGDTIQHALVFQGSPGDYDWPANATVDGVEIGGKPWLIIAFLLQWYTNIGQPPLSLIPTIPSELSYESFDNFGDESPWEREIKQWLDYNLSVVISEPMAVEGLINGLLESIGGHLWWEGTLSGTKPRNMRVQLVRPYESYGAEITDDNMISDSLQTRRLDGKRKSEIWSYYGKINPTGGDEEASNYAGAYVLFSGESAQIYGGKPERRYLSWIRSTSVGLAAAEKLNAIRLARYAQSPYEHTFRLTRGYIDNVGERCFVRSNLVQDESGAPKEHLCYVKQLKEGGETIEVVAEQLDISDDVDLPDKTDPLRLVIDDDAQNLNLKAIADRDLLADPVNGDTIVFDVLSGVVIGSNSTDDPAIETGSFPSGVTLRIVLNESAFIVGAGGDGGADDKDDGKDGGLAISISTATEIENNGIIGGGGGGGGASVVENTFSVFGETYTLKTTYTGGGGAGRIAGKADGDVTPFLVPGDDGGLEKGGDSEAGDGGDLGQDGEDADSSGGAAGSAITGASNLTWITEGDVRGDIES